MTYEAIPKKILRTNEKKIRELIHRHIPSISKENFLIDIKEKNLDIEIPNEAFFIEGLQFMKRALTTDIWKFLPNFEKVLFIESFKKAKPASKPAPKPASEKKPKKGQVL